MTKTAAQHWLRETVRDFLRVQAAYAEQPSIAGRVWKAGLDRLREALADADNAAGELADD